MIFQINCFAGVGFIPVVAIQMVAGKLSGRLKEKAGVGCIIDPLKQWLDGGLKRHKEKRFIKE